MPVFHYPPLSDLVLTFDEEQRHAVWPQPDELAPDVLSRVPVLGDPLRHPGPVKLQRSDPALSPGHTSAAVEIERPDGKLGDVEHLAEGAGLHRVEEGVISEPRGEVEQGGVAGELVTKLCFADTLDHGDKVTATTSELHLLVKCWHSESAVRTSWESLIIVSCGFIMINGAVVAYHCRHSHFCITVVTNLDQSRQEPESEEDQADVENPLACLFSNKCHLSVRTSCHATCNELHVTRDTLSATSASVTVTDQ